MWPIIHCLTVLAFLSNEAFADFRPVSGLRIETFGAKDSLGRPLREFRSLRDLTDLHDPRPLIEVGALKIG